MPDTIRRPGFSSPRTPALQKPLGLMIVLIAWLLPTSGALAQTNPRDLTRSKLRVVFEKTAREGGQATARVRSGPDRDSILATFVRKDGYLVTKASELDDDPIEVHWSNQVFEAEVVSESTGDDLALLRIKGQHSITFPKATFQERKVLAGQFMASPRDHRGTLMTGIVAVGTRRIGNAVGKGGFLGVNLEDGDGGTLITRVLNGSAAKSHGIRVGDLILEVDGQSTEDSELLIQAVQKYAPGETIQIRYRRGNDVREQAIVLGKNPRIDSTPTNRRRRRRQPAHPEASGRSSNFDAAFQHDLNLRVHQVGGPIMNLEGEVVGLTIARASRVSGLALPSSRVNAFLKTHLK